MTDNPVSPTCDVCGKSPTRYEVPVFKSFGEREWLRDEHWCSDCYDKITAQQSGEYIWRHATDGWLKPPSSSERSLLSWFQR